MGLKLNVALAIFAAVVHSLHATCDVLALASCLEDFSFDVSLTDLGFYNDIDQVCSDFATLKTCVGSSADGCSATDVIAFETLEDGLGFLCRSDSIQVVKANSDCLTDANPGNVRCATNYRTAPSNNPSSVCSVTDSYLQCAVSAYQSVCSRDVTVWVAQYLDATVGTIERYSNCNLSATKHVASAAPGLSSRSVLTLVSLLILRLLSVE